MRPHTAALTLCAFAIGISACADGVAAPAARQRASGGLFLAEAAPTASSGAQQTQGTGTWVGDGNVYFDCLGEVAHVHNEMPFRWRQVVTPSGNVLFSDPFIPNAGTGQAVGLTSGTIWTLDRVVSPEVINVNAGVEQHFVAVLHWA